MIDLSLLLPTRARPALMSRLLDSIIRTTERPDRLEIVVFLDTDDQASRAIMWPSLRIETVIGQPGQTMGRMTRACYAVSHGRYVMLLNDDVVFRTERWDTRVLTAFEQFDDDLALVYGDDRDQQKARPTLPFVSRVACDQIGDICPGGYHRLHIESHLFDIFLQLAAFGPRRIVYLPEVVFEHMHYAVGKGAFDATSVKHHKQDDDALFIALDEERRHLAGRLAAFIAARERDKRAERAAE
jgi:glycosyltransferase involved in cell wall biosynthesis